MKKMILIIWTLVLCSLPRLSPAQGYADNTATYSGYLPQVVNVFPNPAITHMTVVLSHQLMRRAHIDIIDFNGNVRRSFTFAPGSHKFDLEVGFLNQGYYVLWVREGSVLLDRVKFVKGGVF